VVVEVRLVDALEVFSADGLGDVEADDFGAYGGVEGADFEVLPGGIGLGAHPANVGLGDAFSNELFVGSLFLS
jgi:hypothetical protein